MLIFRKGICQLLKKYDDVTVASSICRVDTGRRIYLAEEARLCRDIVDVFRGWPSRAALA